MNRMNNNDCRLFARPENVKKGEFQICFGAQNLNEEQMSIIFQTKKCSPDNFKFIAMLIFHKMSTEK